MPDPAASLYFGLPGWVYLWALTVVAFSLFGARVARYVGVLRRARPEPRWDHWLRRLGRFAGQVLGQLRLLEERVIGVAHLLIFWAFVFYAASFFWNLVRGLFPFLPIPFADEVPWMAGALFVFGVLGLAALVVAALRRYLFPPPQLERSRDAAVILGLIAVVLISSLLGRALSALAVAMWWTHMATVLGFLAYLPYSKHLHLLAAPFGVLFGAARPGEVPAPSDGAERREEFTWRQLFSGLACAECGRCDRACPSFSSGETLSPKTLMHHLKELVRGADGRSLIGEMVKPEEIWACATCGACMDRCPVFNEHIPVIMELRRRLVARGEISRPLQDALTNLARYGNSTGVSPRARARWTQQLDFKIKDARKEPVEYLWFIGDYASYDPRVVPATLATARLFHRAGLDFGILYEQEQNSGNDARRAGEEGLFETLVDKNTRALTGAKFTKIVTTDPHSYHALKNEYPNGRAPVLHSSEVFAQLLAAGRLAVPNRIAAALTYHDPCYLGRYNGVYAAPRCVLAVAGARVVEMPRHHGRSYCCGAGGGGIWIQDTAARERPAESRLREAAQLPGIDTLVVTCPKDLVMFQDALKTTGLEGRLRVRDLAEFVEQAA